ncbi:MAG TPA: STAS/SEC14 domain-containing protein [Hyphomicrobium sp.]|jgi:hypothetical protein
MIEHLSNFPDDVLAFVCRGRVTKADYDSVLVPAVVKALEKQERVRLYYETAADFSGIDPGAMWEDFKVGMEHLTRWKRVAVVTDVEWIKQTMRLFSFLMPGEMKSFPTSEAAQARATPPILQELASALATPQQEIAPHHALSPRISSGYIRWPSSGILLRRCREITASC